MFDYFIGTVKSLGVNDLVLEVGGIGFDFTISSFCSAKLKIDDTVKVFSYLAVKEDDMSLFGFYSKEEKAMFLRLISISGIGAKGAIAILSGLNLNELCAAIASGNCKAISSVKGIGKKTAERIVLELHDKLSDEFSIGVDVPNSLKGEEDEAVLALMALGMTKQESVNAVKRVDTNGKTVEQIVMAAFRRG